MSDLTGDWAAIAKYLLAHGYSQTATAGILGNMYQESSFNPEAGSWPGNWGLIQWTPGTKAGPADPHTGNRVTDLQNQLTDLISYNNANGASASQMNAAVQGKSAQAAALWYMNQVEKPGVPDAGNRQNAAVEAWQAITHNNWSSSAASAGDTAPATLTGFFSGVSKFFGKFTDMFTIFHNLVSPSFWLRVGAFFAGVLLLAFGIYALIKAADTNSDFMPKMPAAVPVPV